MDNKTISNWIRQTRYRARKHNIHSDVGIADVQKVLTACSHACAYCGGAVETLDCPFPLQPNAPNIPANIVASCKKCKRIKKNNDMIWLFTSGHLTKERYLQILAIIFSMRGGDTIKSHVRLATGLSEK